MDLRLDDRPVVSETLWSVVGPDTVVIETTVPDPPVALSLTSSYVGCPGADTIVAHARSVAGAPPRSWSRSASEELLPVWAAQERCLLDHLGELQECLGAAGVVARIDLVQGQLPVASD